MLRFIVYAVPLLILLLALFGFTVELLDAEPRSGSVIRLALLEQPTVPGQLVIGTWLVEASGLIALFLLAQGRFGAWWLDGLVAGWVAWVFRGPLLVITIVVAARQPQGPWWKLAFGWWVLYSVCGLSLAILARRSGLEPWPIADHKVAVESGGHEASSNQHEVEPPISRNGLSEGIVEKDEIPLEESPPEESPAEDDPVPRDPEEIAAADVPLAPLRRDVPIAETEIPKPEQPEVALARGDTNKE